MGKDVQRLEMDYNAGVKHGLFFREILIMNGIRTGFWALLLVFSTGAALTGGAAPAQAQGSIPMHDAIGSAPVVERAPDLTPPAEEDMDEEDVESATPVTLSTEENTTDMEEESSDETSAPEALTKDGCDFGEWIGFPADEDAAKATGRPYRILKPGEAATMDFLPERINIDVNETDIVISVHCG